ncbi:MAG TPA: tetratricopeptide repeat protein [Gemmatimonadales bacterium]|nr:tetratricopeptide repeat protein [Gemmatimonadales bacterium]
MSLLVAVLMMTQLPANRPPLPGVSGDPNDWQSYFDQGAQLLRRHPNRADSMFIWASHLDPTRAEPLFARWVAFWMRDVRRFERAVYREGRLSPGDSALIRGADSLFLHALERNPFVPQNLIVLAYEDVAMDMPENSLNMGFFAYGRQQYTLAASHLGQAITQNPKLLWLHYDRALTFVPRQEYDSAAVELAALLAALRSQEQKRMSPIYESKELITYGLGVLHLVEGHNDSAQQFFEQAVTENLAFFPAQVELGDLALIHRDTVLASRSFRQAADLAPAEAWVQARYGVALQLMGRSIDAMDPLQRAIKLEPWWAEPYRLLGLAWEDAGDKQEAAKAFAAYLERAPQRETDKINDVKRRLAAAQARN